MRTIKFRGQTEEGKWIFGYLCSDYEISDINTVDKGCYEVIPETIGQFSNLYDTKENEIYEGDIFSVNGKYNKIVKYINEYACFCVANIDDLKNESWKEIWQQPSLGWWNDFKRNIEVIGNIHDNPELLSKK